jgi:broad specificity phosphatase PhoE
MSILHLVRHGQASFGSHDYDRLSSRGMQQVERLEAHWHSLGDQPTALYSGPLRRQKQTAELLARRSNLNIIEHPAFKEFDASEVLQAYASASGLNMSDPHAPLALERPGVSSELMHSTDTAHNPERLRRFQTGLEAATLAWVRGELRGELESWPDFRGRVIDTVENLINDAGRSQTLVVCTSAGVIGAALGHWMGLHDEGAIRLSWVLLNASVSSVLFDEKRRSVLCFNTLPHLEQAAYRDWVTRI